MSPRVTTITTHLHRHPGRLIAAIAILTALLTVPFLTMAPETSASTEPTGDVFTARDRIDETFVSNVHPTLIIVEHESGDVLTVDALGSLLNAERSLRSDPILGATLISYFDVETDRTIDGLISLADLVDDSLRDTGIDGIAAATDEQVKAIGTAIIDELGERSPLLAISAQSARTADGWNVPALTITVLSDNDALGFGNRSVNLGGSTEIEEFDRALQERFRVDGWQANGVAIDVNLTSQEQGAVAGPFIGFTILAVLLLVGLTFRSYWILAVVSTSFLTLIIWLKGISNLIGLKDDLVLSLIVPVAMVSFGVDFAFHAIGRYREERAEGRSSGPAIIAGTTAVSGALLLALTSDAMAFLANLTSGIESIQQFGFGAAIALASAYLLLGVAAPIVIASIEGVVPTPDPRRRSSALRIAGSIGAAALTMTSVLLLVFILPWLGAILAALTAVVILVIPVAIQRRKLDRPRVGDAPLASAEGALAAPLGRLVRQLAIRPLIVLPAAIAITVVTGFFALQVPAAFDVEDFFSGDTDFVVGLEQLDRHVGDRGGEPALLYVEGPLDDPEDLARLADHLEDIRSLDTSSLARGADGLVHVEAGIFDVFDAVFAGSPVQSIVAEQTGIDITDVDGNRIPDTPEQVRALIATASMIGVPIDADRLALTPDDVMTVVQLDGPTSSTVFEMGVVDSRNQASVTATRNALEPIADAISADLGGTFVQVTGSAFVREASLDATNRALFVSLPVALVLCLLVGSTFLRSIRYGLASIVPIIMVVAWLYAFMYAAGFSINLVTATIAAVSIGIGIDFAIHFIARYREELDRHGNRAVAAQITGEGTGVALVASAISSAIGFGILAFAPMPLFAAYGLLTALMIMMALIATLVVLPSILVLLTADRPDGETAIELPDTEAIDPATPLLVPSVAGTQTYSSR